MKITIALAPIAGAVLLACSTPALAEAQDNEAGGIPEIVVTAERRDAELQSVPLSVTAVTAEDLRSLVLIDTIDIPFAVPGVELSQRGLGATPFIRGVGSMNGALGDEAPVAMYVDGVYLANPDATIFELNDVRQVEVIKGPQGTLFGRNATGGVIQVVTRQPQAEPSTEVRLQYGSYATLGGSIYTTGGIGDSSAASLSLYGRDQRDGWGTNVVTGADTFRHRDYGARAQFLWTPGSASRVLLTASHFYKDGEDGMSHHFLPGAVGLDGVTTFSGYYNSASDPQDRADYRHSVISARIEHDFSAAQLVSITSWQSLDAFLRLDQDATPAPIVDAPVSQYARTITQELQLLSRSDDPLQWIAGLYYFNDISAYDPFKLNGAVAAPLTSLEIRSQQHSESYAAFGQATLRLASRLRLTLGSRYTRDERRVDGTTLGLAGTQGIVLGQARQNAAWGKPTWRAALAADLAPDVMAFISWDRGFKSGLYNMVSYTDPPVNPEVLDAWQAGIKSSWLDHRLRLNLSAYRYRYQNIQVEATVAGTIISLNAAAARMHGVDADLDYAPVQSLTFHAGVALLHGRYSNFQNAPITAPARDASGQLVGGNVVTSGDATGLQTARSPARTATVNARYRLFTSRGEMGFSAAYYRNSGFAWDPDNRLKEPAFGILNATIDWTSPSQRVTVRGSGRNLNGAEVCQYGTAPALGDLCSPRAPREVDLDVLLKF